MLKLFIKFVLKLVLYESDYCVYYYITIFYILGIVSIFYLIIKSPSFRCTFVHARDMCNTCEVQLLLRPFYVFPCGHKFHSDCLVAALTPMLSMDQRTKLADLQRQLTAISNRPEDTTSMTSVSLSTRDQIKADIDELVASECLYCGELMIEYVSECRVKQFQL